MATSDSKFLSRKTPGVYITEIPAFGTSIVGVDTAVPVFVGYTEFAGDPKTGASLYGTAIAISSMTEFHAYFGGSAPQKFKVSLLPVTPPAADADDDAATAAAKAGKGKAVQAQTGQDAGETAKVVVAATPDFSAFYMDAGATAASVRGFQLASTALPDQPNHFNLYWQMRLFFANGGSNCFVVSCGSYWTDRLPVTTPDPDGWSAGVIAAADLNDGLAAAAYAVGATMIVVPEACQLAAAEYGKVATTMLAQASELQDRVAILDLPGCLTASTRDDLVAAQTTFWGQIAPQIASASYGAAYAPALVTSIVTPGDILYTMLAGTPADNSVLNNILTSQATRLYDDPKQQAMLRNAIGAAFPVTGTPAGTSTNPADGTGYVDPGESTAAQLALDNLLTNTLPIFAQIQQQIAATMNVMPPSAAIAGVWAKSDAQTGVWNAPANIALASVNAPLYTMNDAEQGAFNLPLNGQAIDVIRAQPNRGNVVWGARTLDGNSQDYRYIQVRRTLIYIEQSAKQALRNYVFAANDATTWSTVTASVASFLTQLWQQGGLMGSKPEDAFAVVCGLGATMTPQQVLDGYMIVAVTLQMIHPAEFIELTFTQKMGS